MRPFKGRCPARKRQGVCGKNGVAGAGDVNSLIAAVNGDLHEAIGWLERDRASDAAEVRAYLKAWIPEYTPHGEVAAPPPASGRVVALRAR